MDPAGPLEPVTGTRAALDHLASSGASDLLDLLRDLGDRLHRVVPDLVGLTIRLVEHAMTFTLVADETRNVAPDAANGPAGGRGGVGPREAEGIAIGRVDPLDEGRWQRAPRADAPTGVASTLALPLYRGGGVVGEATLYAATEAAFDGRHDQLAMILGARVDEAVTNTDLSFSSRADAASAPRRLRDQALIDAAVGLLARQRALSLDDAERHLAKTAERAGVTTTVMARILTLLCRQKGTD